MAINRMFADNEKAVEKRVSKLSKEYLMNWWGWWTVSVLQDQEIVDGMDEWRSAHTLDTCRFVTEMIEDEDGEH